MLKQIAKQALQRTGLRRSDIAAARMACERNLLALAPRRGGVRRHGRVLCYHSVGQPRTGVNDVSPDLFRRQLELAQAMGFRFVPAGEIASGGGAENDLAITFDDAWTSVAEHAAPILRKMDLPWSLFVVSDWSEHSQEWTRDVIMSWRDLEALRGADLEIGSHSVTHPDFGKIDHDRMIRELRDSRDVIADRLGFTPKAFAIPLGQSTNWNAAAHATAQEAGYRAIYAQAEETRFPGTIARTFVTRFDNERVFTALLAGAFDRWEEWA